MAEKLFPLGRKSGPWTAADLIQLKKYLGATNEETIARVLGRSVEEVRAKITELGRIKRGGPWTREDVAEFKRIYGTRTDGDLAKVFGRTEDEVRKCAEKLALSKDKAFLRKLHGESATKMPRWTQQELELLKRDYSTKSNLDIARELGRSVKSVVSKAHHLGLKKSTERLRDMGRENVSLRYKDKS